MSMPSEEELLDTEGVKRNDEGRLRFRIIEANMGGRSDPDE